MKKLLLGVLACTALLLSAAPVSAHVLITDDTKTKGAIFHSIPDDDPVAGQPSTLFFDTQNQLDASGGSVVMTISGSDGSSDSIAMNVDSTLATARYTYPKQGTYQLTFTVRSKDKTFVFRQSQRVSRGVSASALDKPSYAWAEITLLTIMIILALLAIVSFNRRKEIGNQSTF